MFFFKKELLLVLQLVMENLFDSLLKSIKERESKKNEKNRKVDAHRRHSRRDKKGRVFVGAITVALLVFLDSRWTGLTIVTILSRLAFV